MSEENRNIWSVEGGSIRLRGDLDENACPKEMQQAISHAWESRGEQEAIAVRFDQNVRANSCGLASWFKVARGVGARLRYVECPTWLVPELSRMAELLDMNSDIESIVAPYYIPIEDRRVKRLLKVEADLASLSAYAEDNLVLVEDGIVLEPDFEPEQYLQFMKRLNTLGKVRAAK